MMQLGLLCLPYNHGQHIGDQSPNLVLLFFTTRCFVFGARTQHEENNTFSTNSFEEGMLLPPLFTLV